ncbi:hypothetical protein PtA15_8A246 [Puccinia triticina]|uniref:Uncharacterized protein n=1 Tax=Puccinia triticina TaxID=208348 RepID=A0ABY7CX91_9BASI|nr:uncharacterized protein PtA15_8A246 [Puccinia triticina]WAQ87342.1 hypothetical protein PtA15_8A246 [Puccinia triticina]
MSELIIVTASPHRIQISVDKLDKTLHDSTLDSVGHYGDRTYGNYLCVVHH